MALNADQFAELKPLEAQLHKTHAELADRFRKSPHEALRQELLKLENQKFTIHDMGPTTSSQFLALNQNPRAQALKPWLRELFSDVRFRQALAHAIDRESIVINVLNNLGEVAHGVVSSAVKKYYAPHLKTYDYDPQKARKMLEQIGWRDSDRDGYLDKMIGGKKERLEFTLETNSGNREREAICTILVEDFKRVGIKVNYRPADFNTLVTKLMDNFAWEAVVIGLTGGPEPLEAKNVWLSSGHLHMWNPRQPEPLTDWEREIDDIFKRAPFELDPEKRVAMGHRWQLIVTEQLPFIPLTIPTTQRAFRDRITHKLSQESLREVMSIFGVHQEEQLLKRIAQ
jgi:peptide/nickel transport system substrate-binding protein